MLTSAERLTGACACCLRGLDVCRQGECLQLQVTHACTPTQARHKSALRLPHVRP